MIEDICKQIEEQENVRPLLIQLKEALQVQEKEPVLQWERNSRCILNLLQHEDAKTRKNAALLLGMIQMDEYLKPLFEAYRTEQTRFVKSAYLTAMGSMDYVKYLDELQDIYEKLNHMEPSEEEKKHIREERKALEKLLLPYSAVAKHRFVGLDQPLDMILTTLPGQAQVTADQIVDYPVKIMTSGVKVNRGQLRKLLKIRTFREVLLFVKAPSHMPEDPKVIAKELIRGGLVTLLEKLHEGSAPFYFRIQYRQSDGKVAGDFIRKVADCMEEESGRALINSTDHYECEIRLKRNKDNTLYALLRLCTIPDKRFTYRKQVTATSMHPVTAATLLRLAQPYLRENAQVLDPFCGVGTLLIERAGLSSVGDMYGVDTFGDAIAGARENTGMAGLSVNYIHRDFFDFTHGYLFDEMLVDFPPRGKKTREEQEKFYAAFFEKAATHMQRRGILVIYSEEEGMMKKNLRLRPEFVLKKEYVIRKTEGFHLYIVGYYSEPRENL